MNTPISDTYGQQLRAMRTEVLAQLRAQRGGKIALRLRLFCCCLRHLTPPEP